MKLTWKGRWKRGEITIEAETLEELESFLTKLNAVSSGEEEMTEAERPEFPTVSGEVGCVDAIRSIMQTEWGKTPRTMAEVREILEANGAYFTKGTLSGTLTLMTQRGELGRFRKNGKWVYSLKQG